MVLPNPCCWGCLWVAIFVVVTVILKGLRPLSDLRVFSLQICPCFFFGAYPPAGSANTSAGPPPILPPWCSATSCWCQITLLLFCKLVVGSWKQVFVEHFEAQTRHVAVLLQVADGCWWCRGGTVKTDGRGLGGGRKQVFAYHSR